MVSMTIDYYPFISSIDYWFSFIFKLVASWFWHWFRYASLHRLFDSDSYVVFKKINKSKTETGLLLDDFITVYVKTGRRPDDFIFKKKGQPTFGRTTSPLISSFPLTTRPTFTIKLSTDPFLQIRGQSDLELQISQVLVSLHVALNVIVNVIQLSYMNSLFILFVMDFHLPPI